LDTTARILIVEDEPILALELKEDLVDLGFTVLEILADADMVLHTFLKSKPNVVLMDIKLHGFRDGIDAASQIRAFYKTPIVFISSYPEKEVGERLTRTAPYAYVQKPYELNHLKEVLNSILLVQA